MAIEVTVKKTEPVTTAFLSMEGSFDQMGEAFGRLFGWVGERGHVPAGPPFGVYFNDPTQVPAVELLWEIHCPIGSEVSPCDQDERGLGVKRVEGMEVASKMHKGPYDQLGAVYEALFGWILQNGYEVAGPPQEVYLNDPGSTQPEEILTEIRFPVKKK